jgi:hypothetical protein
MAQRTDLYSILMSYANNHHSPYIDIDIFTAFLDKHAKRSAEDAPEWRKWTNDLTAKFWSELSQLVENEKCALLNEKDKNRVFMTDFYIEQVQRAYANPDAAADQPFADEKSLELSLPPDLTRSLPVGEELESYLAEPQDTLLPIIKIVFPEDFGSALVLAAMIPGQLLEAALSKLRNYLRNHQNRDFYQRKLNPQFSGREILVKGALDQLEAQPLGCIPDMESAGEFSALFWTCFCGLVRSEIKRKTEFLSGEIAAVQSAYLIEVCIDFFKTRSLKAKERELALKDLESRFNRPPYLYTLEEIIKFTSSKGTPLLGQYSEEDLESFIRIKTTETNAQELPELIIVHGKKNEQYFIRKDKILPLCTRLLNEARPQIRKGITNRWIAMLREFRREPAMERETEFEKLAARYTVQCAPILSGLLGNQKLFLIYDELERSQEALPHTARFFFKGQLLPMTTLLLLKRKDLLVDARIALPFWYSLPFLPKIIGFFMSLGKKTAKAAPPPEEGDPREAESAAEGEAKSLGMALKAAAQKYENEMVPTGFTLDSYLEELEGRWHKILNKEEQKNLVEDVKALIRDKLRKILRLRTYGKINTGTIDRIAEAIILETPSLRQLDDPEALQLYIRLYVTKALITAKN